MNRVFIERKNPSTEGLDELVSSENFLQLYQEITSVKGDQDGMVVAYLRDVSSILALVSLLRGGNIELHLEAERDILMHLVLSITRTMHITYLINTYFSPI